MRSCQLCGVWWFEGCALLGAEVAAVALNPGCFPKYNLTPDLQLLYVQHSYCRTDCKSYYSTVIVEQTVSPTTVLSDCRAATGACSVTLLGIIWIRGWYRCQVPGARRHLGAIYYLFLCLTIRIYLIETPCIIFIPPVENNSKGVFLKV